MKKLLVSFLIITTSWYAEANIKSTREAIGDSPWHVAIYMYEGSLVDYYKCGGTILTKKIVISVTDCFTEAEGDLVSGVTYKVAAGKIYREFKDDKSTAQKKNVSKIITHEKYRGMTERYSYDVAFVILETELEFNEYVKPIGLDFTIFDEGKISKDVVGKVVGWGRKSAFFDKTAGYLTALRLPLIDYKPCRDKQVLGIFDNPVKDKICAGYLNDTTDCITDNGGGFVLPYEKDGKTEYYLRGLFNKDLLVSFKTGCKSDGYYIFTDVLFHREFILENMELYK